MNSKDKMLALLERAYEEGQAQASQSQPAVADDIPVHNIVNPIVREYFASLPEGGYSQTDVSRMWYYRKYVRPTAEKNMADRGNPYVVYCRGGDSLLLTADGEKPQTILPKNNTYECYILLPNKVYHWKVKKGSKVVREGDFKTIGDIRLINIPTWPNVRDIAYTPKMMAGLVYSGANPDSVVVGSDDYNTIQLLGIDFQLNLRTPSAGSVQNKPWRPDLFPRGTNINIADYSNVFTKTEGFKKAFETLVTELDKGHKVAFNCFAGTDRTGTFRYIIQGLCGVPRHIAQGYYGLTSLMFWENYVYWDEEGEDYFRLFDRDLQAMFGPDYYTQCYRLLTEVVGLPPAQIKALQSCLMVDPSSAPSPILD